MFVTVLDKKRGWRIQKQNGEYAADICGAVSREVAEETCRLLNFRDFVSEAHAST